MIQSENKNSISLDAKIEALLFFKGEPLSIKEIAKHLKTKESVVDDALDALEVNLEGRGLVLVHKDNKLILGTAKEMGPLLEALQKEELSKELSKASLETLSIILYKDGVTRSEIDYIRGVNSSFILRSLLIRGLVERKTHPTDSRKYIYMPTIELLQYLGVSKIEDLPEYSSVREDLNKSVEEIEKQE